MATKKQKKCFRVAVTESRRVYYTVLAHNQDEAQDIIENQDGDFEFESFGDNVNYSDYNITVNQ